MIPWLSRLRKQLTLTAPNGTQYTASWAGNDIEGAKLVGQFNTPLADGTITQDLGSKSLEYPFTLSFEGDNHDQVARLFMTDFLHQRGTWQVVHPQYGSVQLQALTIRISADPTTSGNITKVETTWIEPAGVDTSISSAEIGSQVADAVNTANASAAAQFQAALNIQDSEAMAAASVQGTLSLSSFTGSKLGVLLNGVSEFTAAVTTAYAGVQAALTAIPLDVINGASQIQTLMQLPALVTADLSAKIAAFGDMSSRLLANVLPASDPNTRNSTIMSELFLTACITGAAESVVTSTPVTRDQAVQAINDINALFTSITSALDAVQDIGTGNTIETQYFSNGISFPDLVRLVGLVQAYLLRLIFDLKVAKRFILASPRAPIEITITEYGTEYNPDGTSNLDLFIASNALHGQNIILIPAGTEVVVYV